MNTELRTLIKREQQNPDLQSTLDIEALLNQHVASSSTNVPASNQSLAKLAMDKYQSMYDAKIAGDKIAVFCDRLTEYQYVDKICQLQRGKYIRWIRLETNGERIQDHTLTNGALIANIKFLDKGTNILIKNYNINQYMEIRFNDCLIYQRMKQDELIAIGCAEMLATGNITRP